jgi:hypothetical protein
MEKNHNITYIGVTNYRNKQIPFGIKDKDRLGHIYVIGKTGVGKSTLLLNMAISDIGRGNGLAILDPHGDIAENILNYIPKERIEDVIYFNPSDISYSIAFNPLHGIPPDYHHLVASGLISTFKKIWPESWGPRLEYILNFSLLTLLCYPDATLLDINPLLTDKDFRERVLLNVTNPHILAFWRNEFEKYSPSLRSEAITPILNKTGLFMTSIPLRNTVGQKTTSFKMRKVMDEGKIFIANLSKGKMGEGASAILGSMLLTSMQLAALHRANIPEDKRRPFYLYVDECHSFMSLSFADILAEARKYGLSLFLAHQFIDQLQEKIKSAIFGNVGTLISFRIGAEDAIYLVKEFHPVFDEADLVNLPRYSIYLKLMIDGATSRPFSAETDKLQDQAFSFRNEVISISQRKYGNIREKIEQDIWSQIKNADQAEKPPNTLFK